MDKGRIVGIIAGFLIAIPAVILRLLFRFIQLGCSIFQVKTRTVTPPCLLDPGLGEHKYITVNGGQKIHYVESGDPRKPLLVFVHGFPEFWYCWRFQIKHFQTDYHVVAMDMRGYNESGKPSGIEPYFIKNLADDIKGLVEGLGVSKFTLVAHDWGGAVAWVFAALYPEMLSSLVVLNLPHLLALMDQRKTTWEQALKSWYIIFFQCPVLPELSMMAEDIAIFKKLFGEAGLGDDEEMLEAYKFAFRDYTVWNRAINYYRCSSTNTFQEFLKANKEKLYIKVKTLQIFGTADTALSVTAAKEGEQYIKDGRLELLDGVSHWVQEQAPEKVNQLIGEFLKNTDL